MSRPARRGQRKRATVLRHPACPPRAQSGGRGTDASHRAAIQRTSRIFARHLRLADTHAKTTTTAWLDDLASADSPTVTDLVDLLAADTAAFDKMVKLAKIRDKSLNKAVEHIGARSRVVSVLVLTSPRDADALASVDDDDVVVRVASALWPTVYIGVDAGDRTTAWRCERTLRQHGISTDDAHLTIGVGNGVVLISDTTPAPKGDTSAATAASWLSGERADAPCRPLRATRATQPPPPMTPPPRAFTREPIAAAAVVASTV